MPQSRVASRGLRRLLKLRLLEEEQCRVALESALGELHRLERALQAAGERSERGRQLIHHAAHTGEMLDRIAGLEEGRTALRHAGILQGAIAQSMQSSTVLREQYQAARVERRQVETLMRAADASEALDASRRSQQAIDDWYGSRRKGMKVADTHSDGNKET